MFLPLSRCRTSSTWYQTFGSLTPKATLTNQKKTPLPVGKKTVLFSPTSALREFGRGPFLLDRHRAGEAGRNGGRNFDIGKTGRKWSDIGKKKTKWLFHVGSFKHRFSSTRFILEKKTAVICPQSFDFTTVQSNLRCHLHKVEIPKIRQPQVRPALEQLRGHTVHLAQLRCRSLNSHW